MRITRVEPIVLRLPEIELRADGTQDAFLVRIETDEGLYGIGEGDTAPAVARAAVEMPASHSIAQGLAELLIGRDPLDIEPIWHDLYEKSVHFGHRGVALHAMSAIDIALYDLAGKILGQPVHRLLGGSFRDRVPVYASALMPWTVEHVRELVSGYREQGYGAVKLGWGPIGLDARQDVALVRAAREACGPDLELMIDAGRVWTWKQALQMSRRFEEFELSWLEEPLPVDDLDGYARLCEHSALRIASAENETTIFAFREWVERAGLDIVQPDLARCGGIHPGSPDRGPHVGAEPGDGSPRVLDRHPRRRVPAHDRRDAARDADRVLGRGRAARARSPARPVRARVRRHRAGAHRSRAWASS